MDKYEYMDAVQDLMMELLGDDEAMFDLSMTLVSISQQLGWPVRWEID